MESEEYVRGRLEGLFQLVSLLKDIIGEEEAKSAIVQKLVDHIYAEIEDILDYMGEEIHPEVKEKARVAKESDDVTKKITASYDVLSEIIQKKQGG